MAIMAGVAVLTRVYIVNVVARGTTPWRGCEIVVSVAIVAFDLCVSTGQHIASQVMIEFRFLPVECRVTAVAILTEPATVDVVFFVTTDAAQWCHAISLVCIVAIAAGNAYVRPIQCEIGPAVIKQT